ncbi:hypothetical protein HN51_029323 [Arachis hypogaea]|uniref:Uncharacterized protein n=2 Tax=Arachis TaxID=3817 RepID=A0A445BF45_ARAHY|nr:uncharacterized protein LOC107467481 [Arachis duranensis]XP_029145058.1 uncharacterized protein LOC112711931 [Arachis hypogaea]QHO35928.1 uncharacterized protein DS421_9g279500 [Arachis hypogaea]RYR37297.1 hypothetical protein Ahy_A09g042203 [Arachis hypogaea]
MEKKQGFFSALKEEVVRGLSPSRSRSSSPARAGSPITGLLRRKKHASMDSEIARSGSLRPLGEALAPLMEGPDTEGADGGGSDSKRVGSGIGSWMKGQLSRAPSVSSMSYKRTDLRLLLGVMGAPLAPVYVSAADPLPHLSIKDTPIETSSAHYILQQYTAASGGQKLQNSIRNAYAMGKVRMVASEFETATRVVKNRNASRCAESGGFVLWQMNPDMWYVELAVGGSKVHAGCNGKLVWRHTPWLGAHTAKGPVRPLRRALQGLDPRTTASMFADAKCIGEKNINGEDCFILKLVTDPETLKSRSEGPAEIIRHVLFGYFSQKTGLLVHIEDSHLTRIQSNGGDAVYWETTINSYLDDYRSVEGIMIAHSGHSVVTLFRFGEMAMSHTKTKMEEAWTIEEVAFNVPGLSVDCFIPPADLRTGSVSEACELPQDDRGKNTTSLHRAKVVALEKSHNCSVDNMIWKMEI